MIGNDDEGIDVNESLWRRGSLLDWCATLRESSTGMSDPLPPGEPEQVRAYMQRRLAKWREPSDEWDTLVRRLVEHFLREYHAGPAAEEEVDLDLADRLLRDAVSG
jgi:hypothetical protein